MAGGYRPVEAKVDLPSMEREILEFWREAGIFEKSLSLREGAQRWVFYEGPPTANGKPGIHHVEARVFKDVYPRYKTMRGFSVPRRAGWDCHGIPVELEVEKQIGTKSKRDIEAYGVARFNDLCRRSVKDYVEDWNRLTERIGFWIDLDDAYWTMDTSYIESVWSALKSLYDLGLLFQDDKVTAYCPRCGTPLSDHEVAMGYTQVRDPSLFLKVPLAEGPAHAKGASLVVWTTTPWTLISNLGLAVAPGERYVRVRRDGEDLIVAGARRDELGEGGTVVETFDGAALVGARYLPPFDNVDEDTHRVVGADFVSTQEGTGIVHMAPAFGADDFDVGRREGWPMFNPVDEEGKFTALAPEFVRGLFVKAADAPIIEDLRRRGLVLRADEIEHTYPLCWRCDTPLIYYARPAWYIRTTAVKERLLEVNEGVNWYPDHIKHGRYGDWLANNVDWALSRERYWGTPLPIWICANGHRTVVGSLAELSALAGRDVIDMDPHRPYIDEVTFACPASGCGEQARRVPYLIDVWFDAGAMPYAQWGYPVPGLLGNPEFRRQFPADFIAEGLDQTRGWFYTLMAEGVLLFDSTTYRNVVCLGLLIDRDGRKMSKRLGNTVDPSEVIDRFGADALRWFLVAGGSPWAPRRVYLEVFEDVVRRFLLTLWNTYAFFVTYANIDRPDLSSAPPLTERSLLDRWALSQLHGSIQTVGAAMESYDVTGAARKIEEFVDDLSNWYVRRSRRRFWDAGRSPGGGGDTDKLAGYATLHECLSIVARLMAPIAPFISEAIYRNLVAERAPAGPLSVHLTDFPEADRSLIDPALDEAMASVRSVVSLGRQVRTQAKIRVRQPLTHAALHVAGDRERLRPLLPLIAEELNVKDVIFAESAHELSVWRAKPNFRALGPRLGPDVQEAATALAADDGSLAAALARGESVSIELAAGPLVLSPEDVELAQQTQTGWGVASDGMITVALDLEPTEELRLEGLVRELTRHVQDLRKAAGLDVADRIVLGIDGDDEVLSAVEAHRDHLSAEVLATQVRRGRIEEPNAAADIRLDGHTVTLSIRAGHGPAGSPRLPGDGPSG
jgi:isoleucyl-tRNA synthetase